MLTIKKIKILWWCIAVLAYTFLRWGGVIVWQYDDIAIILFASYFMWLLVSLEGDIFTISKCEKYLDNQNLEYAYLVGINTVIYKIYVRVKEEESTFSPWYELDYLACFGFDFTNDKMIDYNEYSAFIENNPTIHDLLTTMNKMTTNKKVNIALDSRATSAYSYQFLFGLFLFFASVIYMSWRGLNERVIRNTYNHEKENIFEQDMKYDNMYYYPQSNYEYTNESYEEAKDTCY